MFKHQQNIENPEEPIELYEGFEGNDENGKPLKKKMMETIIDLLISGKLKREYIIRLLKNPEVVKLYERNFTHQSYDPVYNYEFYEFLGDGTVNNCTIWYVSRKFNEYELSLKPDEVLTRLKITLVQEKGLAKFAQELGFWPFIRASTISRRSEMLPILEDVFEAFFGTTQWVIDKYIGQGAGFAICYNIISNLLDQDPRIKKFVARREQGLPAIDYFSVCDSVTILKQTMEDATLNARYIGRIIPNPDPKVIEMDAVREKQYMRNNFGQRVPKYQPSARIMKPAEYVTERTEVEIEGAVYRKVFVEFWLQRGQIEGKGNNLTFTPHNQPIVLIGKGHGFEQKKAIQAASANALVTLQKMGLTKPIPQSYLCTARTD
jgi:dsRNA-specific ribonuclease